jgi:O-antigen ligase
VLTVTSNPVLGDYGSYPVGEYAHNLFSVWVDLGLLGFLLFSTLLLVPLVHLLTQFNARARDPEYVLALTVLILSIALFLTSKNFTYQLLPVAVGLYSRDCARRAHLRHMRARLMSSTPVHVRFERASPELRGGA